jgi:hypothetical protein
MNRLLPLAVIVILALSSRLSAQPPLGRQEIEAPEPPNASELARAMAATASATRDDLLRQRLAAAHAWQQARREEFWAGRVTLEPTVDAASWIRDAELSLHTRPVERVAAYERYWKAILEIELMNQARRAAGRIPTAEFAQSRYARFDAQLAWVEAKTRYGMTQPLRALSLDATLPRNLDETKAFAQALHEAVQLSRVELRAARAEAAQLWSRARFEEFLSGKGMLDSLLEAQGAVINAEQAELGEDADPVAFAEARWLQARWVDQIEQDRYNAGRLPHSEFSQARFTRLWAEMALAQAKANAKSATVPRGAGKPRPFDFMVFIDDSPDLAQSVRRGFKEEVSHDYAQFKLEMVRVPAQARPQQLAEDCVTAAERGYMFRQEEFLAGKGVIDLLLGCSQRWRDAELALHSAPADRIAAHERHWKRTVLIELVTQRRWERGRVTTAEAAQSTWARLDAQLAWLNAKSEGAK